MKTTVKRTRVKTYKVEVRCSCGKSTPYAESSRFCQAVKEQFIEDHRGHEVRVVTG